MGFADQSFMQTAAFNLLFWGIGVAFLLALFRLLEAVFTRRRSSKTA